MAVINPIENGLHSLATALMGIQRMLAGDADRYLGKEIILRTHHAIETVLKAALIEMNPVFVFDERLTFESFFKSYAEFKAGSNAFMIERTIGLQRTLERLRRFEELNGLRDEEYRDFRERLEELEAIRNQFQHLGGDMDSKLVLRVTGAVIPRFLDVVDELSGSRARTYQFWFRNYSSEGPDFEGFRLNLTRLFPDAETVLNDLRRGHDQIAKNIFEGLRGKTFPALSLAAELRDIEFMLQEAPEVKLSGVVNAEVTHTDIRLITAIYESIRPPSHLLEERRKKPHIQGIERYDASVTFSKPEWDNSFQFNVDIEIALQFRFSVARGYLNLGPGADVMDLVRSVDVAIVLKAKCTAAGDSSRVHFLLTNRRGDASGNVRALQGTLQMTMTILPPGTIEPEHHSLTGVYSSDLTRENTFFDLHGWFSPDGALERPSGRWSSEASADLVFAAQDPAP